MNNTFNIQRFGLLLKRQWLEFGKIYLITLAVALGVLITFYGFSLKNVITEEYGFTPRVLQFREPLFLIFGFLFITVIASSYFAHLGQKPKAIIDLMIPASTFEKFLTGVIFTAVLSTLSFVLIFYLTDLAFIAKVKAISSNYNQEATYFFAKNSPKEFHSIYVIIPMFVTSIFLAGSIYFNKFHYIKTAISVMIFSGLWAFLIYKTGQLLFEGKVRVEQVSMNTNDAPKGWIELGVFAVFLLLTAIFWTITYVRLKEKQV
ncbi:MAG: hypothetical protein EOP00_05235 [Pedobacter sp.]|nr:MAG: hypothetical protein EOP00_05235 [Pedobacter sp.]